MHVYVTVAEVRSTGQFMESIVSKYCVYNNQQCAVCMNSEYTRGTAVEVIYCRTLSTLSMPQVLVTMWLQHYWTCLTLETSHWLAQMASAAWETELIVKILHNHN